MSLCGVNGTWTVEQLSAGPLQVFVRKDTNTSPTAKNSNYLSSHFSDVRSGKQTARNQPAAAGTDAARKMFQKQKELEKLLMKAENEDISMLLYV